MISSSLLTRHNTHTPVAEVSLADTVTTVSNTTLALLPPGTTHSRGRRRRHPAPGVCGCVWGAAVAARPGFGESGPGSAGLRASHDLRADSKRHPRLGHPVLAAGGGDTQDLCSAKGRDPDPRGRGLWTSQGRHKGLDPLATQVWRQIVVSLELC